MLIRPTRENNEVLCGRRVHNDYGGSYVVEDCDVYLCPINMVVSFVRTAICYEAVVLVLNEHGLFWSYEGEFVKSSSS
jgi:hypothetical protein